MLPKFFLSDLCQHSYNPGVQVNFTNIYKYRYRYRQIDRSCQIYAKILIIQECKSVFLIYID